MKIEVKNVSKSFKGVSILSNISMTFESGKIYGLIGRNGSGKSVFLKLLCTFYEPSDGEILYDGINIIKMGKFPPYTRALIEKPYFIADLTGYENLKLLAKLSLTDDEKIIESLKKVNLCEDKDKKFSQYSLGMKQKLGIAQVLMDDPKIIILDEPFNGIEEKTTEELRQIFIDEAKKDKIVIIATHIKDDIEKMVDILYKFDDGKVSTIDIIDKNKD